MESGSLANILQPLGMGNLCSSVDMGENLTMRVGKKLVKQLTLVLN